ncbi:MAG: hypothetical protein V3S10_02925, partial [Dehalococcoidales bacterium]
MREDEVREDNGAQLAEGAVDSGEEPDGGSREAGERPPDENPSDNEATIPDPQARIAELEAALADGEGETATLRESVTDLEGKLAAAVDSLAEAVASYRAVIVRANPEVVEDLITGDTIDAIDESLVTARNVIDRVKRGMEEETALARVPAGAPERRTPDLSALSSREKIQY